MLKKQSIISTDGKVVRYKLKFADLYASVNRPLILDGAMGSLLTERNLPIDEILWSSALNITHPDAIQKIHEEYIDAGAEIITTNTFRTNPAAVSKSALKIKNEELVRLSVSIAMNARARKNILIAGSNAPAEECYQKERTISTDELKNNHHSHISWLWESGSDIIWNETQSHLDEIIIISKFCSENSIPYVISLYFDSYLRLLSGERVVEVFDRISEYSPDAIGFNCMKSNMLSKFIENYSLPVNWGFYLNCCVGERESNFSVCGLEPADYIKEIKPLLDLKPFFAGACCGSNPSHTIAIKDLFNEIYRN